MRLILYFSAAILLIALLMFIPAVAQLDGVVSDHWSDCLELHSPQPTLPFRKMPAGRAMVAGDVSFRRNNKL